MANDNRRSRRVTNDESIKLKKKVTQDASPASNSRPGDASSSRRPSREISSKKQTKENPTNTRKSERLENMKPSDTPPIKEKSERTQEQMTINPMKRYDRRKKHSSLRSLENFVEDPASSNTKSKKEKVGRSLKQSVMDTSEDKSHEKQGVNVGGRKRKRVATSINKALSKPQHLKTEADMDKELKREEKLCHIDDSKKESSGSKSVEDKNDDGEECSDRMGEESMLKASKRQCSTSHSGLGKFDVKEINDHNEVEEICVGCSKNRRTNHGLGKQQCDTTCITGLCDPPSSKDRTPCESARQAEIVEKNIGVSRMGTSKCFACKLDGKLRYCDAVGCNRCYHLSCLDPPVNNVPLGNWRCTFCVKNNKSSVPSVSGVPESIWDTREVEVSDAEGLRKQKQYFVKYIGLAHIHNQWVTESKLLCEAPLLVDTLSLLPYIESLWLGGSMRWTEEWTVPHHLLKKRLLLTFKSLYKDQQNTGKVLNYHYEWLVKWQGLGDEQATWESETISVLDSPEGHKLIKEYEKHHGNTKISPLPDVKAEELPLRLPTIPNCPPGMDNIHFNYVKNLHDAWNKGQNSVVFDDQERAMRIVLFIISLKGVTRPFLLITTSDSVSRWEAMFLKIAPCNDLKVSLEEAEGQRSSRLLEFQKEDGQLAFQVLLFPVDTFGKDLNVLKAIKWKAIIVDESQSSEISAHFGHIKSLSTDKMLLIICGQLSVNMAGYLDMLSLLDCDSALPDYVVSNNELNDISRLKETLSEFIAYECKSSSSKFVEFWVPVQISNVQLEQYCSMLLSNAMALSSCSKSDTFGALHDILVSNRKCCDHPYIVDQSLQGFMTKDIEPANFLDVGIKASGKLQFLDLILPEMRKRQLRVLILFQPLSGSGKGSTSIGDILDDFVRQRFGGDSYERIDGIGTVPSKKQAALNNFNNKEMGRFVFLLEYRACLPSIKLSSVDTIVIFDSDWNPANDLRALQKITIDSQSEQIMILRLYTSCTLEEKILRLAEHSVTIDSKLQNLSRSTSDALLMWGATYLFNRLDEFHSASELNGFSAEEGFWNELIEEFLNLISDECKNKDPDKLRITKVQPISGTYRKSLPSPSELITQLPDGEQPHTFWRNLLVGRNPSWKYLSISTPRHRKRPQYYEESPKKTNGSNGDVGRKRKKTANNIVEPLASKPVTEEGETPRACTGDSRVLSHNGSQSSPVDSIFCAALCDEARFRYLLKVNISKLCEVLRLSEDVKIMVESFLEYVIENYHVNKEPANTLQAFLLSLCWIGSALLKHKLDRSQSLVLANEHLNFSCKEEEVNSVYLKLEPAKETFLHCTENQKKTDISKGLIPTDMGKQVDSVGMEVVVAENQKTAEVDTILNRSHNGEDINDISCNDVEGHAIGAIAVKCNQKHPERGTISHHTSDALEDEIDSGSSNVSTSALAAASKENVAVVQLLVSSACHQPVSTNLEIGKEPLRAQEVQGSPSLLTEISNLQTTDGGKVGQVNPEDSSLQPHPEELCFPLLANPMAAENGTHTHPAEKHDIPSDHTILPRVNMEDRPVVSAKTPLGEQHSDLHLADRVDCQPIDERPNLSKAPPQVLEITTDVTITNHDSTPPGPSMSNVQGSNDLNQALRMHRHFPSSLNPLEAELEKLSALKESVIRYHEDIKLKLKSDYEKELEEIRRKYEAKRQDADAAFQLKKKEVDINYNRVILNKILAEAFRSKCQDLHPSDPSGIQVTRSGGMRHSHTLPSSGGRSTGVLSSSPAQSSGNQQVTKLQPPLQIVNQSAKLFSTTPSKPSSNTNPSSIPTRPTSNLNPITSSSMPSRPPSNAVSISSPSGSLPNTNPITPSSRLSRPPLSINPITPFSRPSPNINFVNPSSRPSRPPPNINPITPSSRHSNPATPYARNNLRVTSEIRAPAPHIRPFKPSTSVSHDHSSPRVMSSQHTSTSLQQSSPTLSQAAARPPLLPFLQTTPPVPANHNGHPMQNSPRSLSAASKVLAQVSSQPPSVAMAPPASVPSASVPTTPPASVMPASVPPASVPTAPPASVPPASVPTAPPASVPPASEPMAPPASLPTAPLPIAPPASVPVTAPTAPPASLPTSPLPIAPPASVQVTAPRSFQLPLSYSSLQSEQNPSGNLPATCSSHSQISLPPLPSISISHSGLYSAQGRPESGIQLPGPDILSLPALDLLMDIDKQAGFHLPPNMVPSTSEFLDVSEFGKAVAAGDIVCLSDDD